jgi:hypothetical protein
MVAENLHLMPEACWVVAQHLTPQKDSDCSSWHRVEVLRNMMCYWEIALESFFNRLGRLLSMPSLLARY